MTQHSSAGYITKSGGFAITIDSIVLYSQVGIIEKLRFVLNLL